MRTHFDPKTGNWVAPKNVYKAYSNIALMFECIDPNSHRCGQVETMFVDLSQIPKAQIMQFASYYVFSDFQRRQIVEWMFDFHKIQGVPDWRDNSCILTSNQMPDPEEAEKLPKGRRRKEDVEAGKMLRVAPVVRENDRYDLRGMAPEHIAAYREQHIETFGTDPALHQNAQLNNDPYHNLHLRRKEKKLKISPKNPFTGLEPYEYYHQCIKLSHTVHMPPIEITDYLLEYGEEYKDEQFHRPNWPYLQKLMKEHQEAQTKASPDQPTE